ncbi:MAG: hypothetical protein WBM24_03770 [Candidatus Sulfotelmatobacter sp.]
MPMRVHAVDAMIDLCGPIDLVYAQSFRRAAAIDAEAATSILFRMGVGMSAVSLSLWQPGRASTFRCMVRRVQRGSKEPSMVPTRHPRSGAPACRHVQVPAGEGSGKDMAGGDDRHPV